MTPMTPEQALKVLGELTTRFAATIPTPMNKRGESTMCIEHHIDLSYEAKQALATLTKLLATRKAADALTDERREAVKEYLASHDKSDPISGLLTDIFGEVK